MGRAGKAKVILRQITLDECQLVREWRNDPALLPSFRTKEPLTEEQQALFWRDFVCHPASPHRYYALEHNGQFIGMGGVTYLTGHRLPHNEISLVLGPEFRGKGLGSAAVDALISQAFGPLDLPTLCGECYPQGAIRFWNLEVMRHCVKYHTEVEFGNDGTLFWTWYRGDTCRKRS